MKFLFVKRSQLPIRILLGPKYSPPDPISFNTIKYIKTIQLKYFSYYENVMYMDVQRLKRYFIIIFLMQTNGHKKEVHTRVVWKVSDLAYNQRETQDKRPLCRDLHTCVKLFWSQPMAPWSSVAVYECAAAQSMDPWAANKKALRSVAVIPALVRVPTQRPLIPRFTSIVG